MAGRRVLNAFEPVNPDTLAAFIANKYDEYKMARASKESDWQEVQRYVFATDTTTTANSKLPWKNKTTRPKLTQIRDNLHANYMAAIFPTEDWFNWEAAEPSSADKDKAQAIKVYMKNKLKQSRFEETVSRLVLDFIDFGNAIGDAEYANEVFQNSAGEQVNGYVGPRAFRISPYDITFDITAATFEQAPKIVQPPLVR